MSGGLNLHAIVRGAIGTVNGDITVQYRQSTGAAAVLGKLTPTYAADVPMQAQVQPVGGSDLRKYNFLNAQGTYKAVYMYGATDAIVRSMQKGGDILVFADPESGNQVATWLVTKTDETWAPGVGWCRVIVTLQLDPDNPQ